MKTKKVTKLLVSIVIIFTIGASISSASSESFIKSYKTTEPDENEYCIIDNPKVPYVSQETGFYCRFASLTMLIKYYVDNVTLKEVLFNSGIGYTLVYFHPLKIHPLPGIVICQLQDYTGKFLAPLYGLSYEYWIAKNTGDRWEQYWPTLKEKINNNIPVVTDVDPFALPWYKKNINISDGMHDSHSIVIVGYNESADLVFYNDPGPTVGGESEQNCTYVPLSIETLKDALKNNSMSITKYMIESFEKTSNPKSKEEIFNISHERNIQRMNGKYSELLFNIIPLTDYGVEAVKEMKRDLEIGFRHRFSTIMLMKFFKIINFTVPIGPTKGDLMASQVLKILAIEKQNMSQYLLENQDLSSVCVMEGALLAQEANHWNNLSELDTELFKASFYGPVKSWIKSKPILDQMINELDQIITINQKIF